MVPWHSCTVVAVVSTCHTQKSVMHERLNVQRKCGRPRKRQRDDTGVSLATNVMRVRHVCQGTLARRARCARRATERAIDGLQGAPLRRGRSRSQRSLRNFKRRSKSCEQMRPLPAHAPTGSRESTSVRSTTSCTSSALIGRRTTPRRSSATTAPNIFCTPRTSAPLSHPGTQDSRASLRCCSASFAPRGS